MAWSTAVVMSILTLGESMLDASFMQGTSSVIEAIDNPGALAESYAKRYLSSFIVPTIVRDVGSIADPTRRYTTDFIEESKERFGWFADDLPVKPDLWGRDQVAGSGLGWAYDMGVPFFASKSDQQPIDAEMVNDGWYLGDPTRGFTIDKQSIKLKGRDGFAIYSRYVKLQGGTKPSAMPVPTDEMVNLAKGSPEALIERYGDRSLMETLNDVVMGNAGDLSAEYMAIDNPIDRKGFIMKIADRYRSAAKAVVFTEHPELLEKARRLRESGRAPRISAPLELQ